MMSILNLPYKHQSTDPFGQGIQLSIAASHDEACRAWAMKQPLAMDTHHPQKAPMFGVGRRELLPFRRQHMVEKLHELGTISGLGQGVWNGHSFPVWQHPGLPKLEFQSL